MELINHLLDTVVVRVRANDRRCMISACVMALCICAAPGLSMDSGFYEGDKLPKVLQEWELADRTIRCRGKDQIDLGITSEPTGEPLYFSRKQIAHFLKSEKHRNLLVVLFEKPILASHQEALIAKELQSVLDESGYKRVLILGAHTFGLFVIEDKIYEKAD